MQNPSFCLYCQSFDTCSNHPHPEHCTHPFIISFPPTLPKRNWTFSSNFCLTLSSCLRFLARSPSFSFLSYLPFYTVLQSHSLILTFKTQHNYPRAVQAVSVPHTSHFPGVHLSTETSCLFYPSPCTRNIDHTPWATKPHVALPYVCSSRQTIFTALLHHSKFSQKYLYNVRVYIS